MGRYKLLVTTNQCPLISGCVRQLKRQRHHELDSDIDIEELEFAARRVNTTPEYVRLRAFFLIEEMLALVDSRFKTFKTETTPVLNLRLVERTWSDLTRVKNDIEKLDRETDLEIAEYSLSGCTVEDNIVVVHGDQRSPKESFQTSQRIKLAQSISKLCAVTGAAIRALRPHLQNEDAPLDHISSGIAHVLREIYGVTATPYLSEIIHKLIGMRM